MSIDMPKKKFPHLRSFGVADFFCIFGQKKTCVKKSTKTLGSHFEFSLISHILMITKKSRPSDKGFQKMIKRLLVFKETVPKPGNKKFGFDYLKA